MSIRTPEMIWLCVYGAGIVLSVALLYWRWGDWRVVPRTQQDRLVNIAARSALQKIVLWLGYFVVGFLLAVTLIWWRETGNAAWLNRWREAFVWVLITMGVLILLGLVVLVMQRYRMDREVGRQLAEEAKQAALSNPPWDNE